MLCQNFNNEVYFSLKIYSAFLYLSGRLIVSYCYFILQAFKECFCSNVTNTDNFIEMDPRNCDMPCSGNSSDICGGAWRISVYRICKTIIDKKNNIDTKA